MYLLQVKFDGEFASPLWHCPLHLLGTGGIPSSLKLGDSGQIPVKVNSCLKSHDLDGQVSYAILFVSTFMAKQSFDA